MFTDPVIAPHLKDEEEIQHGHNLGNTAPEFNKINLIKI